MPAEKSGVKTVLFEPWGNNNGHVTHCVTLGRAAMGSGWRAVIAHHGDPLHCRLIEESGCESVDYPQPTPADKWLCWSDQSYVEAAVVADMELIARFKADVVVHDIRMSSPIAACAAGVGCASICHQPLLPGFSYPGLGVSSLWLDSIDTFNQVLTNFGQREVRRDLRELFVRDAVLIPSVPEFDPLPDTEVNGTSAYIGPLVTALLDTTPRSFVRENHSSKGIFFYRTVGVNSRIREFCEVFADLDDQIFIATGTDDAAAKLQRSCAGTGFKIRSLWDMNEVFGRTSVAVHHGGPGTCLRCLQGGMPSVVLPGDNPERCFYGEKLQSLGLGVSLSPGPSLDTAWGAAVDATGQAPTWSDVRHHVERLRADVEVLRNIEVWRTQLTRFNGGLATKILNSIRLSAGRG